MDTILGTVRGFRILHGGCCMEVTKDEFVAAMEGLEFAGDAAKVFKLLDADQSAAP